MEKSRGPNSTKAIGFKSDFELLRHFHADRYLRFNARRLEHLASLRIKVAGMSVLEVGAGIGDHSLYYLDRGCDLTITESREENLRFLKQRYPGRKVRHLDLDHPSKIGGSPFDIVHCHGLLNHFSDLKTGAAGMS